MAAPPRDLHRPQHARQLQLRVLVSRRADAAHHFAAFLQLGFSAGSAIGSAVAYLMDLSNPADQELGRIAAGLGASLRSGALKAEDLGYQIRKTLCK